MAVGLDLVLRLVDIGRQAVLDVCIVGNLVILRRQIDRAIGDIKGNVRFTDSVIVKDACPAIGASGSVGVVVVVVVSRLSCHSCRLGRLWSERSPTGNRRHGSASRADRTLGLGRFGGDGTFGRCYRRRTTRARYGGAGGNVFFGRGGRGRGRAGGVEVFDRDGRIEFGDKVGRDETV